MTDEDGTLHDGSILRLCGSVVDERAIDLQCGDWKALEIAQGGITGPEVVDSNAKTAMIETPQVFEDGLFRFDQDILRQFDADIPRT